jgi:hypothetical protein
MADLTSLFAARDAVLQAWRTEVMPPDAARIRLRALGARDASGGWWRLRPGPTGAVLIRIGVDGSVAVADPGDYRAPPRPVPRWRRAAVAVAAVLWTLVLVRYLRGV